MWEKLGGAEKHDQDNLSKFFFQLKKLWLMKNTGEYSM